MTISSWGAGRTIRRARLTSRGAGFTARRTTGRALACLTCLTYCTRFAGFSATWTAPPPTSAPLTARADNFARAIRTDITDALSAWRRGRSREGSPCSAHIQPAETQRVIDAAMVLTAFRTYQFGILTAGEDQKDVDPAAIKARAQPMTMPGRSTFSIFSGARNGAATRAIRRVMGRACAKACCQYVKTGEPFVRSASAGWRNEIRRLPPAPRRRAGRWFGDRETAPRPRRRLRHPAPRRMSAPPPDAW